MNSSTIIFIFYGIANIMEFITGYFFMKCMDCTMKRRKGKILFLIGLVLYTVIATLVVFPKDMTNISIGSAFICPGKFYAVSRKMAGKAFYDSCFSAHRSLC